MTGTDEIEYGLCWHRSISSFSGVVPGASHYMVRIRGGRRRIEVLFVMDEADAKKLSSFDCTEMAGNWSGRFFTEKDAEAASLAAFEALAGPNDILTHGGYLDEVVAVGSAITMPEFENEDRISEWVLRFSRPEHDRMIGYNAPPSIIEDGEFILVHDGDGWKPQEGQS